MATFRFPVFTFMKGFLSSPSTDYFSSLTPLPFRCSKATKSCTCLKSLENYSSCWLLDDAVSVTVTTQRRRQDCPKMINGKVLGRQGPWPNWGTILVFTWKE
jgi:hypothetical protein